MAGMAAEIEGGGKATLYVIEPLRQPLGDFAEQEVVIIDARRRAIAVHPQELPVEDPDRRFRHAGYMARRVTPKKHGEAAIGFGAGPNPAPSIDSWPRAGLRWRPC